MKQEHLDRYKKLGLKISYYRKLKGLTQEQLAEQLDRNIAHIGAIEAPNVERSLSLDTLFDIADALGVPPRRFFEFDEE